MQMNNDTIEAAYGHYIDGAKEMRDFIREHLRKKAGV